MGVVYKAEDTKLHTTVPLKFLRPEAVESEELKTRFLHEAEAAAALTCHPERSTASRWTLRRAERAPNAASRRRSTKQ